VLAPSAHRAGIEPRSSALSAHRALGALLAPFGRPTQLTLRPRAAGAGFRFADVLYYYKYLNSTDLIDLLYTDLIIYRVRIKPSIKPALNLN